MGLTFKDSANRSKVYLDGKPHGTIKKVVKAGMKEEWRYYLENGRSELFGPSFIAGPYSTRQACKDSLKED